MSKVKGTFILKCIKTLESEFKRINKIYFCGALKPHDIDICPLPGRYGEVDLCNKEIRINIAAIKGDSESLEVCKLTLLHEALHIWIFQLSGSKCEPAENSHGVKFKAECDRVSALHGWYKCTSKRRAVNWPHAHVKGKEFFMLHYKVDCEVDAADRAEREKHIQERAVQFTPETQLLLNQLADQDRFDEIEAIRAAAAAERGALLREIEHSNDKISSLKRSLS